MSCEEVSPSAEVSDTCPCFVSQGSGAAPRVTFGLILREKSNDCIGSCPISTLSERFLAHQDCSGKRKGVGRSLSPPDWLLIPHLIVSPRHCVVLLTGEGEKFAEAYEAFLTFAVANTKDTLKFVHIYSDRQPEFADALLMDEEKYHGRSAVRVSFRVFNPFFF